MEKDTLRQRFDGFKTDSIIPGNEESIPGKEEPVLGGDFGGGAFGCAAADMIRLHQQDLCPCLGPIIPGNEESIPGKVPILYAR